MSCTGESSQANRAGKDKANGKTLNPNVFEFEDTQNTHTHTHKHTHAHTLSLSFAQTHKDEEIFQLEIFNLN